MRIVFHLCFIVLRSALTGLSVIVTGWLLVVAPTDAERRTLSATAAISDKSLRDAVIELRLARAALRLAPDLAVSLIQHQSGGTATRQQVKAGLQAIAAGHKLVSYGAPLDAPAPQLPTGAKFLKPPSGG